LARRRAAAGDAAYLRGDYGTASSAYREAVELDPEDDAAWTGLALVSGVSGLLNRPEAVAAIYRVLARASDSTNANPAESANANAANANAASANATSANGTNADAGNANAAGAKPEASASPRSQTEASANESADRVGGVDPVALASWVFR
jgi:tetratricopeptide (TPR) repeat protein